MDKDTKKLLNANEKIALFQRALEALEFVDKATEGESEWNRRLVAHAQLAVWRCYATCAANHERGNEASNPARPLWQRLNFDVEHYDGKRGADELLAFARSLREVTSALSSNNN